MRAIRFITLLVLATAVAVVIAGGAAASPAAAHAASVVGHLYVNDNTSGSSRSSLPYPAMATYRRALSS